MTTQNHGFTLIELLVTVALVGLLAVSVMPFTSDWVTNSRIKETRGLLQQAVSTAQARALRNPNGLGPDVPVAVVCPAVDDDGTAMLQVRQVTNPNIDPATDNPCDEAHSDEDNNLNPLWETRLNGSVALQHGANNAEQPLSYIFFNNRGSLMDNVACPETNKCATQPRLKIAPSGTSDVEGLVVQAY